MTYSTGNLIEAGDFNGFVGTYPGASTGANQLNTVLGIGYGRSGYGQTSQARVTGGNTVSYTDWSNLVNNVKNLANHQNTTITAITTPTSGNTIAPLGGAGTMLTNLTSIYNARNNAAAQGTTSATTSTYTSAWANNVAFTFQCTFSNADYARYFFNAGGQFAITCAHPTGTGINGGFNALATAVGTVVISSPNSGTVSIAGTSYSGITKVGGSGTASVLSTNTGYYGLATTNTEIFRQVAGSGPTGYTSSYITMSAKTNALNAGGNGDAGSIITVYVTFQEVPTGLTATSGTNATLTVRYPSSTYLTNTWGTVSVTQSSTGV
jgi:hypothetical protein